MLAILQGIKEQAPAEHQYFGRGDLDESKKRLEKLPPDASSFTRFSLLGEVGYNELLYGDIQLAIDHLLAAYQLLPSVVSEKADASKEASLHVKFILGVAYLRLGETHSIFRHVNSGGSFGCNPLRQNIGLGNADSIDRVEIYGPKSDTTQTFREVAMDQAIQIVEGDDRFTCINVKVLFWALVWKIAEDVRCLHPDPAK